MLAWVHQAMAGEHELLESLFDLRSHGNRRVGETRVFSPRAASFPSSATGDGLYTPKGMDEVEAAAKADRDRVRRMLDRNLEGCARPLRVRVNQTIRSQEGSIVTYQLATLLHFYKLTMDRSIGADALLSRTLSECAICLPHSRCQG